MRNFTQPDSLKAIESIVVTLSQRSVGLIAEAASRFGHGQLSAELLKADLSDGDPGQTDRHGKSISRDRRATAAAKRGLERKNWDGLVALGERVLNAFATEGELPDWARDLVASLRSDGFEAIPDEVVSDVEVPWIPVRKSRTWTVTPLGEEDVPLTANATALATELRSRGLHTAATHFDQAIHSFADGRRRRPTDNFEQPSRTC